MDILQWKQRFLKSLLPSSNKKIVLITGARQTGKTSLVQCLYPELQYINFDLLENREKIRQLSVERWGSAVGQAVIDEVQKEPQTLEKIKYLYDAGKLDFMVLLGSSQILLLKQIRESLAGRVSIYELFPLMMSELLSTEEKALSVPLFDHLLMGANIEDVLNSQSEVLFGEEESKKKEAQSHLLQWGGMPALINLRESEREKWIKDYEYTYLERDLSDLVRLSDLYPFRTLQKIAALKTAQILSYSELARDAGIGVDRARRYLEYLKISYQVIFLPPFYESLSKRLIKTPKLYWLDLGICRQLSGFRGQVNGEIFETMVVSECFKWIQTMQRRADLYFYRTHGGVEVDLLIETPHGILGIEIKSRQSLVKKDTKHLLDLAKKFGSRWIGGVIIYSGERLYRFSKSPIWAIPSWRLFT